MAQDRSLDRNNNGDREFRPSTGRNHSLDWDKRERAPDYRWAHDRNTGDNRHITKAGKEGGDRVNSHTDLDV